MKPGPVAVIGAGWAGLAAAVALTRSGRQVQLYEVAPQAGGRARTAPAFGLDVDNGQHLAIGAYNAVTDLLGTIGVDPGIVFARLPMHLVQYDRDGRRRMSLHAPSGAGRIGVGLAFLAAAGFSALEKAAIVRGWRQLLSPRAGVTVREALREAGQPDAAKDLIWEPLCIATLNTAPDEASAALFANVLRESLAAAKPGASDLLLPATDLGKVLPEPALDWLRRHGAQVHLGTRAIALHPGARGIEAVVTAQGTHAVSAVVLAVPADACARLLSPLDTEQALVEACASIDTRPICTVYLRYTEPVRLEPAMVGLTGTLTQWVIDRRVAGQPGILAAVISADGPHMAMDNAALVAQVSTEISRCLPGIGPPAESRVIREKRATFAATPAIEALRPPAVTGTDGLLLAGDWTATGLPATLEGAVRSGYAAARILNGSE